MSFHRTSKALIRDVVGYGGRVPLVRELLTTIHNATHRHEPWMRKHPFDIEHKTTTYGFLPRWLLRSGGSADAHVTAYAGCQPSCLRRALSVIPQPDSYTFVDLGCGKGRALIVASELPFRRVFGIELAAGLVAVARRNAKVIRRSHPERTEIEVVHGDATAVGLPDGSLVVFLYHSFGPELIARMLARIKQAAAGQAGPTFLIYENPVYGAMVDADEAFTRWHAETVPCTANEIGFAPDDSDTVVVWRTGGRSAGPRRDGADTPIVVTGPGWKAELASGGS